MSECVSLGFFLSGAAEPQKTGDLDSFKEAKTYLEFLFRKTKQKILEFHQMGIPKLKLGWTFLNKSEHQFWLIFLSQVV